ncbi:MAG TPA: hypothetical protein VLC98_09785 [Phnomibacter sp.]|nr:hypothetical protein [Phnomibacter sp.]
MKKHFTLGSIICLLLTTAILPGFAQRVGIGTSTPLARLAIDSGLMVDQLSANQGSLSPGILFGNEGLIGISSSRLIGSTYRNGLSFYTNGGRRMIIDSVGNIGINGPATAGIRLTVNGSALITSNLETYNLTQTYNLVVTNRTTLNTEVTQDALLYMKGRSFTPGNWGMHLVMEAASSTDSGAILYDGDMKFRVFGAGDAYYFRNDANTTLVSFNSAGTISAAGDIVAGGRGMVQSSNGNQIQLIPHATPANLNFTIGPGSSVSFGIGFTAFTSDPVICPGNWTGVSDASHLVTTASVVNLNSATLVVRNVGTATVTATNAQLFSIIAGVRN